MKRLLKCRVTIFLVAAWCVLSAAGYLGRDTIYKNYKIDTAKTPYFVLVLWGIHDNIYPWEAETLPKEVFAGTLEKQDVLEERKAVALAGEQKSGEIKIDEKKTEEIKPQETQQTREVRIKKFVQVDDSYFDDAVFIGDSRTVGLHDYGGLDGADFFATVGMNVYDLWTEKFCEVDGREVTLEEALLAKQYAKVYFQIGINEMGRGTLEDFMENYSASVEKIKQLQPDAIVYVQAIMKVAREKSDSDAIFNNEGIQKRNEQIAGLADGERVFYIDVNEAVCDENGDLKESLTFDNLHLYGSKYDIWVEFLKTKGIEGRT